MIFPDWVSRHKKKGTELRHLKGKYYLYKVSSVWDSKKKRARKITGSFLGAITTEGLVKPKHERAKAALMNVTVKEFGATKFLTEHCENIISALKNEYPQEWKLIFCFSVFRLLHNSPIKNLMHHYSASFLSETFPQLSFYPKGISKLLNELGQDRERIKLFLQHFIQGTKFAVIDSTHIFSLSEGINAAVIGHNSEKEYVPQSRLLLIHSLDKHTPAYFRLVVGSITDVSSIVLTVKEAGIKDVVLIGDKGFHSEKNLEELEKDNLHYILPIKRNSSLIDYSPFSQADKIKLDGHFFFEKRVIWHSTKKIKKRKIVTFMDNNLKNEEEKDFLTRIEKQEQTLKEFQEKQYMLGTITIITDCKNTPEEIYELLKQRIEIENVFDTLKNTLNADRTYMRNDAQLEAWMFINFIALLMHYKIYNTLTRIKLLKKYSIKDILLHLSRVYKLKIQEEWILSEIPKTSQKIIEKLDIQKHIT